MYMNPRDQFAISLELSRFLVLHPREIARLPRWLPQRSISPMDLHAPWWPYDATAWIDEHLPPQARVFEYGGGGSTLWLHDHGAVVTVVEHNTAWCQQLTEALPPKIHVLERPPDALGKVTSQVDPGFFDNYVNAILKRRTKA